MKITVTQDHIDRGQPRICYACPVAIAIKEATGKSAVVSSLGIIIDDLIGAPEAVYDFVEDFDAGRVVYPFTFEIPVDG